MAPVKKHSDNGEGSKFITFILSTYEESLGTYSLADGLKLLQIFFFPSGVGVGGWVGTLCSTLFWSRYLSTLHNYLKLEYMVIHLLLMTCVFFFNFWLSMLEFRVGVVLIDLYKLLYHGSDYSITLAFMSLHTGSVLVLFLNMDQQIAVSALGEIDKVILDFSYKMF